jgi:SAM-dependent methyltransferase
MPERFAREQPSEYAPSHDEVLTGLAAAENYNRWLFSRAVPFLGERVLDAGAGIGTFSAYASEHADVTSLEPDAVFAEQLRRRFAGNGRVTVLEGDVETIDTAELAARFDSIVCFNVLEHVADDVAALSRFREVLRPGGRLLLLVPAHPSLASPFDRAVGHERRYTKPQLAAALRAAQLIVEQNRYVNPVGALGWLVSMRLGRRDALPGGQVSLFDRLVPVLRPLDALRLPFGQSLWAVARR